MRDTPISKEELIGFFESIDEDVVKVSDLKAQIKAINADISDRIKITSEEFEVSGKDLKNAYKYYTENLGKDPSEIVDDYFVLVSIIDTALEEDAQAANP